MSEASSYAPHPPKRSFDLTVNLGHVLILVGTGAGLIGSHYVGEQRLAALERTTSNIETKLDRFVSVVIDAAVTAQRLKDLERRIEMAERR